MTPHHLRQQRLALGLSSSRFAHTIGISPDDVMRWERGLAPMPPPFVIELAIAYVALASENVTARRPQHDALHPASRRVADEQTSAAAR